MIDSTMKQRVSWEDNGFKDDPFRAGACGSSAQFGGWTSMQGSQASEHQEIRRVGTQLPVLIFRKNQLVFGYIAVCVCVKII